MVKRGKDACQKILTEFGVQDPHGKKRTHSKKSFSGLCICTVALTCTQAHNKLINAIKLFKKRNKNNFSVKFRII